MFTPLDTRIVLVQPSHPGNIGSAARAMKTMGLHDLVIVNPKRYPAPEAKMMAVGADDLLQNARVVETLDEAIADCSLVLGTSARDRSLPWPLVHPPKAAEIILSQDSSVKTAILFGREDKGLKNEELQRCHHHIQIPANPEYSSLNLAAAVQVLCYQLRMSYVDANEKPLKPSIEFGYDDALADAAAMESFFNNLDDVLHDIGFLNRDTPNRVMPRMRRLYNRARIDHTELNILRGMLSGIEKYMEKSGKD